MAGADGSLEGYRVPDGVEEPGAPKGSAAGVLAPARPVVVGGYVRSVRGELTFPESPSGEPTRVVTGVGGPHLEQEWVEALTTSRP
jgi:hypothetical protein